MIALRIAAPALETSARHHEVVTLGRRVSTQGEDAVSDTRQSVGLLHPQLARAQEPGSRRARARPRAARTGTSSITSGSSQASIRVERIPSHGATHNSPTGSPTSSWSTRTSVCDTHPLHHLEEVDRLGLRPTPSIVSSLPVSAAAATRNAADEGSPGTVPEKPSCWKRSTRTVEPSTWTGPPRRADRPLGVVAGGDGSATDGDAVGIESREQHRALHLGRGHGRVMVDAVQRSPHDGDRRMAVRRLDLGAHRSQGRGDAFHRARSKAGIAGQHVRNGDAASSPASSRIEVPEFPQSRSSRRLDQSRAALTLDFKWRCEASTPCVPRGTVTLRDRGSVRAHAWSAGRALRQTTREARSGRADVEGTAEARPDGWASSGRGEDEPPMGDRFVAWHRRVPSRVPPGRSRTRMSLTPA